MANLHMDAEHFRTGGSFTRGSNSHSESTPKMRRDDTVENTQSLQYKLDNIGLLVFLIKVILN